MDLSIINVSVYYFDRSSSVSLEVLLVLSRVVVIRYCDLGTNRVDTAAIFHGSHLVAGMIRCIDSDLNIIGLVAGRKVDRKLLSICQLIILHVCSRFIDRIGSTVDAVRSRIALYLLAIHINVITDILKSGTVYIRTGICNCYIECYSMVEEVSSIRISMCNTACCLDRRGRSYDIPRFGCRSCAVKYQLVGCRKSLGLSVKCKEVACSVLHNEISDRDDLLSCRDYSYAVCIVGIILADSAFFTGFNS